MGCAMQEVKQEHQQTTPIQMDISTYFSQVTAKNSDASGSLNVECKQQQTVDQQLDASQQSKSSQLKKSHSALVKILESAPIHPRTFQHPNAPAEESQTLTTKNIPPSNVIGNSEPSRYSHHHHYRKRSKHSMDRNSDNQDRSSEEDDELCKGGGGVLDEKTNVGPWKKTRISREWRQKKQEQLHLHHHKQRSQCNQSLETNNCHESIEPTDHLANVNDNNVNDDGDSSCDCSSDDNNSWWRRSLSDSSESIQNDSGCDSDCIENITDLCNKFEENLSENDVIINFGFNLNSFCRLMMFFFWYNL